MTDAEKEVREAAKMIFRDSESVNVWLCTPAPALAGHAPIKHIETPQGLAEVIGLIQGLAYGNFQ